MNRLYSKLKDFGLIFPVESSVEKEIIKISKALKTADIPVAIFPYEKNQKINSLKISNENEDMFLGALCSSFYDDIKSAISSGAHFIICDLQNMEDIKKCISEGFDIILQVHSIEDIKKAVSIENEAIIVNCQDKNYRELIDFTLSSTTQTLFLKGDKSNLPFRKMIGQNTFSAYLLDETFSGKGDQEIIIKAHEYLYQLLGLKFSHLQIQENSPRLEDAKVFAALSSIPFFTDGEKDLLIIDVLDMDRTIAHLKWKDIYMDPLSSRMDGSTILETELYTEFLGWSVKLVNRS